ncbi:MAG: hypothetical protein KTR15_04045 [Phycisphaeraceae bacterium]|nr:hypothetical protein [Phycisphaeraceae bacterium]
MDIKANIDKEAFGYRNRLLLIAVGALFYAALCVYDAKIKYPDQIEAREALEDLKVKSPSDWKDRWPEVAEANGWDPTKEPKERSQGDIATQWWQFAVVFPIGTYCLISVLIWSRRSIGIDETRFYAYGGAEVPFEAITRIDASRWDRKGIARVYYNAGEIEKSVLIDDFKFERQPTDEIFKRLKEAVGEDKVEGLEEADAALESSDPPAENEQQPV